MAHIAPRLLLGNLNPCNLYFLKLINRRGEDVVNLHVNLGSRTHNISGFTEGDDFTTSELMLAKEGRARKMRREKVAVNALMPSGSQLPKPLNY